MKNKKIVNFNDDRHLPSELWMDILARLNFTTLLMLRLVCKVWNSIITSHEFHMLHLRCFNDNREAKFLLSFDGSSDKHLVIRHNHSFTLLRGIRLHRKVYYNFSDFVGYVDGVLLFYRIYTSGSYVKLKDFKEIVLWNPSIPNIIEIPSPFKRKKNINVGFGFDNVSNHYKVVVLYMGCPYYITTRIYHLRNECSWSREKRTKCPSPSTKLYIKPGSWMTNYDGGIYWFCYDTVDRTYGLSRLLRFDLSTEIYTCIGLPKDDNKFGENVEDFRRLSVTNGLLTVLECCFSRHVSVWVLETDGRIDSWKKLYSVDIPIYECLILKRNADLLFREHRNWTVSCNLKTVKKKYVDKYRGEDICFMLPYEESLVLLEQFVNKGRSISDQSMAFFGQYFDTYGKVIVFKLEFVEE